MATKQKRGPASEPETPEPKKTRRVGGASGAKLEFPRGWGGQERYEAPGDATWQPSVDTSGSFRASFYIGVDDDHKLSAARSALEAGELGPAVVTKRRGQMGEIHAYVKDFRDEADVRRVAEKLGEIGFCQSAATGTAKAKTGFISLKPEMFTRNGTEPASTNVMVWRFKHVPGKGSYLQRVEPSWHKNAPRDPFWRHSGNGSRDPDLGGAHAVIRRGDGEAAADVVAPGSRGPY